WWAPVLVARVRGRSALRSLFTERGYAPVVYPRSVRPLRDGSALGWRLEEAGGVRGGSGVPGLGALEGLPAHRGVDAVGAGGGVVVDLEVHEVPAPLG